MAAAYIIINHFFAKINPCNAADEFTHSTKHSTVKGYSVIYSC